MTAGSNHSILERNILHAFEGETDGADALSAGVDAFLRGAARDVLKAEKAGYDAIRCVDLLGPKIMAAERVFASQRGFGNGAADAVMTFMLERSYRRYFPDGRAA